MYIQQITFCNLSDTHSRSHDITYLVHTAEHILSAVCHIFIHICHIIIHHTYLVHTVEHILSAVCHIFIHICHIIIRHTYLVHTAEHSLSAVCHIIIHICHIIIPIVYIQQRTFYQQITFYLHTADHILSIFFTFYLFFFSVNLGAAGRLSWKWSGGTQSVGQQRDVCISIQKYVCIHGTSHSWILDAFPRLVRPLREKIRQQVERASSSSLQGCCDSWSRMISATCG